LPVSGKGERAGRAGESGGRGDSRENSPPRLYGAPKSASSPLTGGLNFSPMRRELLAQGAHGSAGSRAPPSSLPPFLPPPPPPTSSSLSLVRPCAFSLPQLNPHPSSRSLFSPPLPHSPPPSPGIPGTAVSQPWRRVARGNCASRRRRADVTPAMELTRAAPLYAVVEGNKKCKSKRVGVGEWEKKNKRRARVERGERARAGKERNIETERERERERESENRARSNAAGKGTQRAERERERERGWKFRVASCTCPGLCAMFNPRG